MEENKILDAPHRTRMKQRAYSIEQGVRNMGHGTKNKKLLAICSMLCASCFMTFALCLSACAPPRIIFLDDPLSAEEHLNLGVTYEKKGELDNALGEYREASKKLPLAYLYMGNIYFQKNEYDEAEFYYKKAIGEDPRNADAYNNLAWLYFIKKEKLDDAERLVLKAIELNSSKKATYIDTLEKIKGLR